MIRHRLFRSAALGLALVAFSAPAALAQQDLRSPDSRDAGSPAQQTQQDVRSPDARDAAGVHAQPQDLRAPDTRDSVAGRGTSTAPEVTVVRVSEPAKPAPTGGLDWRDVAIGAAFAVALGLIALGLARHNPKRSVTSRTA
jgi:hypothetical protein